MPQIRFDRQTLPTQPWKNGGGVTREVLCLPTGSDMLHFDWRVSIAHIASSGPFSIFAGVDRVITLLEGRGMALRSDDGAIDHRLDCPLEPFAFAGEAAVQAELLGADCHDLNVMARRAACRARVQVLREEQDLAPAHQGLLLAVRGDWALQGEPGLSTGQGLWWHAAAWGCRLRPQSPDAAIIAVLIESATP